MINVLTVFGTRPEAIKMAPVIKALEDSPTVFNSRVCVTAQHRHLLDQVMNLFNIQPDYDLDIMQQGQDLFDVTSRVLNGMKGVLNDFMPNIMLVHGDTTTAMASALAAYYSQIRIGHVEAGLRTFNKCAPFPEEINRQIIGLLADIHFAPTFASKDNLAREGKQDRYIHITGNTVIDALLWVSKMIDTNATVRVQLDQAYSYLAHHRRMILVTAHRRENFGENFENICHALADIAALNPDVDIVYPVHPNPNVQKPVNHILKRKGLKNIYLIEPIDYLPFIYLLKRSHLVLTDSGGVQEEAPSLGKPVLVMREATERPEAVNAGTVILVGADRIKIVEAVFNLLTDNEAYLSMSLAHNPYGDGKAAKRIVKALIDFYSPGTRAETATQTPTVA